MLVQADENHTFIATSPVKKPGIFMPCGSETISRRKNTTICCGFIKTETAAYGGRFSCFSFVAVFSTGNEVGIDENVSVGYKGKFVQD